MRPQLHCWHTADHARVQGVSKLSNGIKTCGCHAGDKTKRNAPTHTHNVWLEKAKVWGPKGSTSAHEHVKIVLTSDVCSIYICKFFLFYMQTCKPHSDNTFHTNNVISLNTGIMIPLFKYKPFFIEIRDFVQITLSAYRYCCQKRIFDSKSRISSLWEDFCS